MPAFHVLRRNARLTSIAAAVFLSARGAHAQIPATAQPVPGGGQFASVRGLVLDSLHGTPLIGALIRIDGQPREAMSDSIGEYHLDSIPPGAHKLVVFHPLLDTLGIALVTPQITLAAGKREIVDLGVPSSQRLVQLLCPAARMVLGPAALIGFVRDADTEAPAEGSKVSLLWYESDPLGFKKTPRVRETQVTPEGRYKICGIPGEMTGAKVQVFRNGVSTGEVPVEIKDGFLALRSLSIGAHVEIATVPVPVADTVPAKPGAAPTQQPARPATQRLARGRAKVTGRVLGRGGVPVAGARVGVQGTSAASISRQNGEFSLDSLPSGTQTIEVRKLGYALQEEAVELSAGRPAQVTINMSEFTPTLEPMRVTATRDRGLQDVGFSMRKRTGMGHYLEGEQIPKTLQVSDALRAVPGLRVVPAGNGTNVIQSSRDPNGGCVVFWVDGMQWQQQFPGDLDAYVRSDEVAAIEVYSGSTVPGEFTTAGQSGCTTVVMWTERRINRNRKK